MSSKRRVRIVADSSSNLTALEYAEFASAPLKIITDDREFTDDSALDVEEMVHYFDTYKGKSKTACPNPSDWLEAFGDADDVFCVTITSGLSGCYNTACAAKKIYETEHEGKRVYVVDSLSTGPEMALIIRKLEEMILSGKTFEEMCEEISAYQKKTGLLFILESMKNLANNGRVSKIAAKVAGVMGIRVIGKASDVGQLAPLDKIRGEKAAVSKMAERMVELGYRGGRLYMAHCINEALAQSVKRTVLDKFPSADILIEKCSGLCSYYAEKGGLLVGFEKA